jgi:two-component system, NarL family, response regulator YdfI
VTDAVRVYIVAGSAPQRSGLETLVKRAERLVAVGSGNLSSAVPQHADVVLSETLAGEVPQQSLTPPPYWVTLVEDAQASWVHKALSEGLRGVLPLRARDREVELAVESAAHGLVTLFPDYLPQRQQEAVLEPSPLSQREQEVLGYLALGGSNKEIASKINISEHTVKFHLNSIFAKLRANNRSEAVATGIRRGLLRL